MLGGLHVVAALRAELGVRLLWRAALGARGDDALTPVLLGEVLVFLAHLGVRHTSSTDLSACAAAISTPRSGAHCLQRPFFSFQHCSRHIQALQRGHCTNFGRICSVPLTKALSLAFSQAADFTRWATSAPWLKIPPKKLLAPSSTLVAALMLHVSNSVRYPLPQRAQRNSN